MSDPEISIPLAARTFAGAEMPIPLLPMIWIFLKSLNSIIFDQPLDSWHGSLGGAAAFFIAGGHVFGIVGSQVLDRGQQQNFAFGFTDFVPVFFLNHDIQG